MVVQGPAEHSVQLHQRRRRTGLVLADMRGRFVQTLGARRDQFGRAIAVLAVLSLGIFMTWLVVVGLGIHGAAVAVTCLVLPAIAALAFSDHLSEITAGGFSAKFRKTAKRPVKTLMVSAVTPAYLPMRKGGLRDLDVWITHNAHNSLLPVVLTLELHEQYSAPVLQHYVAGLSRRFPHFAFVAVLDEQGRHLCHVEPSAILDSPHDDTGGHPARSFAEELVRLIRDGQVQALYGLPSMRRETVRASASLKKALQLMRAAHSARLLVVDANNRPVGVLEQADALTELMLSVTGA
jgi:CBS domain-containing protein